MAISDWSRNIKKNKPYIEILIAGFIFIAVFMAKAGILNMPYHWDELGAYVGPSHWLAQGGLWKILPGLHPPALFFGHPPAFYFSLSALYRLVGEELWVSHVFAVAFSFLTIYFTYLLASHLFGRMTGILAGLLLFFSPIYFAQSGMATAEPMVTALGLMCVYYFLRGRYLAYLICGVILVMTKETSAATIAALLIYVFITERKEPGVAAKILRYSVPLLLLAAFFVSQKITAGVFLPNPYFKSHPFIRVSAESFLWIFYYQYRWILSCLILANFLINGRTAWKKEFILFLLIVLFFATTFSFVYFLPRYAMAALPYFFILGVYSLVFLCRDIRVQVATAMIILVLFLTGMHGSDRECGSCENDMQYTDVVMTHKEACNYLEEKFPGKTVLAAWPLSLELTQPHLGYVTRPIKVVSFDDQFDILLFTRQGGRDNEKLRRLSSLNHMILDRRIERNNKYVEIYLSR